MRVRLWFLSAGLALGTVGCGPSIEVRTMAAPNAGFSTLNTFNILPGPARRDGRPVTGSDDPMISNSIANRVIREHVVRAFGERGYTLNETRPDFSVAFYASAREKLDIDVWDYGYPARPGWPWHGPPRQSVTQYTEGSVVIDVINSTTRELLWRAEGTVPMSDDATDNVKRLAKVAETVIAKFPRAGTPLVAALP